jgi:hypothetical protein
VLKTASGTVLSCTPTSVVAGSSGVIKCTAKVYGFSPTGTVTWSSTGTGSVKFVRNRCSLAKGACSVTMKGKTSGMVVVQATYGGDRNNEDSFGTQDLTIRKSTS